MALSDTSKTLISIKKLVGKAHTSNDKDVANESLPTGITLASNTIFAQTIPVHTGATAQYEILSNSLGSGVVEFLRLSASFINGTDTSDGRHGFQLNLPDDYETNSKNTKAGTYPFKNQQAIYITSGSLQLIPPSFDSDYEAIPYHTGSGQTQIPVLDSRDWSLDYFNGIFFQQDPPGTGDQSTNPRYIDAYLYIGEFSDKGIFSSGLSGSLTQLTDGTSFLSAGGDITIVSSSNGPINIASNAQEQRKKFVYEVTSSHESSATLDIAGINFSLVDNDPNRIDVFINGQLMTSGSSKDYTLSGNNAGLEFYFELISGDIVSVRTY
jgi:hypothetical protein|tara:strand:+ start:6661 stop:7635 length:975 start_codon:yes stop_codon:yes gene_type:complete